MGRLRRRGIYDEKFGNVARVLLALLASERRGRRLSISELQAVSGVSKSVYHGHLYGSLRDAGLIEEEEGRDRVYVMLSERGRELALCLARVADALGLQSLLNDG